MDLNDLLLRLARVLGNEGQVGPHLLPAVEDGDLDHLAGRDPDLIQLAQQALSSSIRGAQRMTSGS